MIVDCMTRVWDSPNQMGDGFLASLRRHRQLPWEDFDAGSEAYQKAIEPVAVALLHGCEYAKQGSHITLERVAEVVEASDNKVVGFAGIDPMAQPINEMLDKVERATLLGLKGITISPPMSDMHPSHSSAMALYEVCESKGLPIFLEIGGVNAKQARMTFAQPMMFDEVAAEFPELKILISGFGDPFIDQTLGLLAKHKNVFTELSTLVVQPWRLYNALVSAYQMDVIDHILLGSGFPIHRPEQAILTLYSIGSIASGTNLPGVPREHLRGIVERDALSLLGLEHPLPIRTTIPESGEVTVLSSSDTPSELPPELPPELSSETSLETSPELATDISTEATQEPPVESTSEISQDAKNSPA